jgi:tRNA threonylcarbamoyladenosine biosynthesis protein TsaB
VLAQAQSNLDFSAHLPKLRPPMAALTQLLASHGCILVLDASATTVQVGLLRSSASPVWHCSNAESGQALFTCAEACLADAGASLGDVDAFVFCEGPGSTLGIRTAAMAIRTWQTATARPAYSYQSLMLLAHDLRRTGTPAPFSVMADARRDTWHAVSVDPAGGVQPLRRVATADLAASRDTLFQPASFRSWSPPPRATRDCAYDVATLLASLAGQDLFTATEAPDAFQHEAPSYKKWSAQVHSAATVLRP